MFTAPAAPTEPTASRVWAVAMVAGLIGSALSLGVVAVTGRLSADVIAKPAIEKVAVRPVAEASNVGTSGQGVVMIAKTVAPALARIEPMTSTAKPLGSAMLVRDDGYLVTNAHVVARLSEVHVILADGMTLEGRVVGADATTDVAVVKVDRDQLSVAVLGSATELQTGQAAISIGSPLGSAGSPTVTVGVVSAIGRRINSPDGVELHDMIQTDAPIADGASGGALCDGSGAVIGMTTAVASTSDTDTTGLGFAIPIEIVRAIAEDIISSGAPHQPWLGVEGADLDPSNAKDRGISGGAKVTRVVDDSPAAAAGLQSDDVIIAVNGTKVTTMSSFVVALRGHHAGDNITLDIMRGTEPQTISIILGEKNHA